MAAEERVLEALFDMDAVTALSPRQLAGAAAAMRRWF